MAKTEFQKMMDQELYDVNDEKLVHDRFAARDLYESLDNIPFREKDRVTAVVKQLFGSVGKNVEIRPRFVCDYGYNIHVGDNFFANFDCILLDTCEITIGNNVLLAPRVQIYTAGHPFNIADRTSWLGNGAPVAIGDNCWIGGNVTIVPGVTIGNNVIVGGGSVVTKSFGNNVVIAGNPARVIKHLDAEGNVIPEEK
ncbi:sugar O-acetyltransferase [Levilactobacillus hammesii]|uniref:Galactoside O-acetyltransferase n=1 Tax=Levilactobacillus hammesii DSM 16381 TaxID=1423753 RepID=A0A0R1UMN3_9LACO|nr:sugar O-acetyltransferase [Levilactobacillus hammesii]KRL94116.1 galactoside O-acetyltransferase [Levilactobacillus hammesii DSM 16381]